MAERSIRLALSADGHSGAEKGHPTVADWKAAARQSREQGAMLLAHIGDWTHHGLPEEAAELGRALIEGFLGETAEEQAAAREQGLQIVGTLGNHDGLKGLGDEIAHTLRELGIPILENQTEIFTFQNGGRLGILGLDGSLSREQFASIEQLDHTDRMIALHQATEEVYGEQFDANMQALEEADVDARVAFTHMPLFPEQYSDSTHHDESYDMSPYFRRRVAASGLIDLVASGHVHSGSGHPSWRRREARGVSREGVVFYNVAGQTRMQEGQPLMEIVDLPLRRFAR